MRRWLPVAVLMFVVVVIAVWFLWQESKRIEHRYPLETAMAVHFIDVGQGGAVFIEKDGMRILYDCGDTFAGPMITDYLAAIGVTKIDAMIISHAHEDHMAGCIHVLKSLPVGTVYHNGSAATTKIWREFLEAAEYADQAATVKQDLSLDGIEFFVGYDSRSRRFSEEADDSIVVRITAGNISVLLTGDCEAPCEREISRTSDVSAEILSVGHHGSNASSTAAFLAAVHPQYAVIQAGEGNQYGHPHPMVLERLREARARVYRTDLSGTVIVRTDGNAISVATEH